MLLRVFRTGVLASAAALALATSTFAATAPAPVFRPILPKLATARIPVYLPSYLPALGSKAYPFVFFSRGRHAYEVDLSAVPNTVGTATLLFDMTANIDSLSPGPHPQKVTLGGGITGYVGSIPGTASDSLTIRWRRGGVVYAIGRLGQAKWLIRAARSVVRVH